MPTPFESAQLNLQLFELRREPVLREARAWFLREFNPESFADVVVLARGERNASFRMVLGYWDMAASLVTTGAIDANAFHAAHGEIFATHTEAAQGCDECCRQSEPAREHGIGSISTCELKTMKSNRAGVFLSC
jgi:hypothetical protein